MKLSIALLSIVLMSPNFAAAASPSKCMDEVQEIVDHMKVATNVVEIFASLRDSKNIDPNYAGDRIDLAKQGFADLTDELLRTVKRCNR